MQKLLKLLQLFKQGHSVANPRLWKERQITATVLAGVILALVNVLQAFGVNIPVDAETTNALAAGIIAVVNVVLTLTTSPTVGVPSTPVEPQFPVVVPELVERRGPNRAKEKPQVVHPEDKQYGQ